MARRVFFSFHFDNDFFRTQQVRNMGALDGQTVCTANAWEKVKEEGDDAIETWIDKNMSGKSCVVVLVGSGTAGRPWIKREIVKGWDAGKGVLGIRIHKLLGTDGKPSSAGANPFDGIKHSKSGKLLSTIAPLCSPTGADSKAAYKSINDNIEDWIEQAIAIRKEN